MIPKIFHAHIPKTAGTSLNEWLDDCVSFAYAKPASWEGDMQQWLKKNGVRGCRIWRAVAETSWDLFDVLHTHENMLPLRPPNSIVLTVLRDPVARSISLFHDQASLTEGDFIHKRPVAVAFHRDCLVLPFSELFKKWSTFRVFRFRYDDFTCRIFLYHDVSYRDFVRMSGEERFWRALTKIERQVDAFGVAEQMDKTVRHFSQVLGLYPKTTLPRVNVGRSPKTAITAEDRRCFESLTVGDRMLYDRLTAKFDKIQVNYTVEDFERDKLRDAVQRIEVKRTTRQIIYKMSAALIGDGFWGRDSRGKPDCCRWSGPTDDSVLYVPAFRTPLVKITIDVRGWMSPEARSTFRVKVWGEPAKYEFAPRKDIADVVTFRGAPREGILKLEFHAPARTDEECGHPFSDGRRKGLSINRIVIEPA
jgi:hypothetical protein